jgi:hypothetical protein
MISSNGWRSFMAEVLARLRELAPYGAIELILPGGSLVALLLWLYRRRKQLPCVARIPLYSHHQTPGVSYDPANR